MPIGFARMAKKKNRGIIMNSRIAKVGDIIGYVSKVLLDKDGKENCWKLSEGKIKSITINSKGKRIKADHFYTLDGEEVESNTAWMEDSERLILTREPFILTDELRNRVTAWISKMNGE